MEDHETLCQKKSFEGVGKRMNALNIYILKTIKYETRE